MKQIVIGTIGHVDHRKTSLTAAITAVLAAQPGTPSAVGNGIPSPTAVPDYPVLTERQRSDDMVFGEHLNRKQRRARGKR